MDRAPICRIGQGILLLLYLLQRFICRFVYLEFKNIDIVVTLYYDVRAAFAVLLLDEDRIAGKQAVYDTHVLVCHEPSGEVRDVVHCIGMST